MTRRTGFLALLAALVAGFVAARTADGDYVRVGTQTWIEVRPRKVAVRFNLGFSSLLALAEMRKADTNKDGKLTEEEETAYLQALAAQVLPKLRFTLDEKPLEFRLVHFEGSGLRGTIEPVAFDTFFDLEADLPQLAGAHELVYHEGTYENEVSQQILYVVTARQEDYASFDMETKTTQVPLPVEGAFQLMGRDVSVRFEFLAKALERDKAEALIEPCMDGLQGTLDALATNVARSAEKDLGALVGGNVRLGAQPTSLALASRTGFKVSATTAQSRGSGAPRATGPSPQQEQTDEEKKLTEGYAMPIGLTSIALFMLWGALHAKGPGHGKTMVAAYLMGSKGRLWDAARLGMIVTITHTAAVWTLGLGIVFLVERWKLHQSSDALRRQSIFYLAIISGIGIMLFGLGLVWRRYRAAKRDEAAHGHTHEHSHAALPEKLEAPKTGKRLVLAAAAPIEVPAAHDHGHGPHTHTHDGHSHSHGDLSEAEHAAYHAQEAARIHTFRDLLSLGLSGGMVPCPSAVFLIIYVLGLPDHNTLKAFVYLAAFSFGLGAVLVAIASAVVLGRTRIANALGSSQGWVIRWAPVIGAVAVTFAGMLVVYEAFDPYFVKTREKVVALVRGPDPNATNTTKVK